MKSKKIAKILRSNTLTKQVFRGVFPCDKIPSIAESTYAVIVNTDNSKKKGSHWILLYVSDQTCIFIDSFGRSINSKLFPADFVRYVSKFIGLKKYRYNPKIVQGLLSDVCAEYCCYWLFKKCLNVADIFKNFGGNLHHNDLQVSRFVSKM